MQLSCSQMLAEISANEARSTTLAAQEKSASNANVAIGVVGAVLFWPALFALDTGDAEKVEMAAYKSRNDHLNSVMRGRDCRTEVAAPPAPAAPAMVAIPAPPQPVAPHCAGGPCTAGDIQ